MDTQPYNVISVMGPHAGEDSTAIFARKIADTHNVGRTLWVIRSHKAKPDMIQWIAAASRARSNDPLCAFLVPSSLGGSAPTKTAETASKYSADQSEWQALPAGMSPVTGQIAPSTCALVFDQLCLQESAIVDL
jgi:hypothetical protein